MTSLESFLRENKKLIGLAAIYFVALLLLKIACLADILGPEGNFIVLPGLIGNKLTIMKIIGLGLLILVLNGSLSLVFWKRARMLSWVSAGVSLLVSALILVKVASTVYFW